MKTILVGSLISFFGIFAGLYFYVSSSLNVAPADQAGTPLAVEDIDEAELVFASLQVERGDMIRQRGELQRLRDELAMREASLIAKREMLLTTIEELRAEQTVYTDVRNKSAAKLAKMFDAMKPDSAAPILSSLDRDTAIDILVRMKERAAAKLLSELSPSLAAELSASLSLRGSRS